SDRGHDESEDSTNRGTFRGLIDFTADLDQTLKDRLQGSSQFKGTSKTIQNELLDSILAVIHEELSKEIKEARYVAIMADETTDTAAKLQMVLVLRYVKDGVPVERETIKLLEILITTPMSTAEAERCFSTLKRVKTFLRSVMCQDRLNALAMPSIECDYIASIPNFNDRVIENFAHQKERRMEFIYKR
ncbi:hypothetical protein ANN_11299, partial [Periplaneta americana]